MSTTEKYLTYRGEIKAAVGVGDTLLFTTVHAEKQPTGVYLLDTDKLTVALNTLPTGGVAITAEDKSVWVAGADGKLYHATSHNGALKPLAASFTDPVVTLTLLAKDRLAVLAGKVVTIVNRKDGKTLQTLELNEPGTSMAADPTGQWLAVGTAKGVVAVYDGEGKPELVQSEAEKLHDGAVTALLFEREELRFFSAGADQKLLNTHARGKLEPEDRGRGNNHTEAVTGLIWGPGERFYSGSKDKTLKAWPRGQGTRPITLKDGVGVVVCLAMVEVHKRPHLVAVCADNTIRLFLLDAAGKFGEASTRLYDAMAWARNELGQEDPRRREPALKGLADNNDTVSVELLSERVGTDPDHGLRALAAQLLGKVTHPRAGKLVEQWIKHNDEAVRVAAFHSLRKHTGDDDLNPMTLALNTEKPDIGKLAVQALESLANKNDQALTKLNEALNSKTLEVRQAALASLEKVYPADSPEADLTGLGSKNADIRKLALIRLFQRNMLQNPKVQATVRWRTEDQDADVRRTAFLVSLYVRDKLVGALRARDPELQRQLVELETFGQEPAEEKKEEKKPEEKKPKGKSKEAKEEKELPKLKLDEQDYHPLLQATASRSLDTCLRGGRGLAILGDPRAFGLLLQLSREDDASARVDVCRALAALDDPRSIKRLRSLLYDTEAQVRDAAFTALTQIHSIDPLENAESGLNASFEDVRRRGLGLLVDLLRKSPPKDIDAPAWKLLARAMNDGHESVRSEAFKAALNLKAAGGGVKTYRYVLQSIHADVRREVLTEVMAQANEEWAWNLLLEFYEDADATLRGEAFDFAVKKSKELAPLEVALKSRYPDVRKLAIDGLVKKRTEAAQRILVTALGDEDREVRQRVMDALISADAVEPLKQALDSKFPDIVVQAARALARHGIKESLKPLVKLATAPEPKEQERVADWAKLVESALGGLADLGDSAALPDVTPLLQSQHADIRKAAAKALAWVAVPNHLEALHQAMQSSDPQVKYHAALGLAYGGDPVVSSLVFSNDAAQVLDSERRLAAAFALGAAGEDQLVVFLDDQSDAILKQALLIMMLLEMKAHQGTPTRCLACLSSRMPRVRLTAARGLESFGDPAAFRDFVVQLFNDRGEETPWKVPAEDIDTVADLLAFAPLQARARTARLLHFATEKEQAAWNQAWTVHKDRYAGEIKKLADKAKERKAVPSQYNASQLQQLAFGAYVGLVREQGSTRGGGRAIPAQQIVRVRQTALSRVLALAKANEEYARAARPVLVQAMGDPNSAVRSQAFEHLQALGMDRAALGAEALETGHTDLGVKGMQLLAGSAEGKEGQAVLEQVMVTRKDDLSMEAAKLLAAQKGEAWVAAKALDAAHENMRQLACTWLASAYDKDDAAKKALRGALKSRYSTVRERAAFELANKKDTTAFEALVKLLETQDAAKQRRVTSSLVTLGDPRAPDAFLDRLEKDPSGTAQADALLSAAGNFRRPENADRLIDLMERNTNWRQGAFNAAFTISGHDQRINDPEDENPDRAWLEKQHKRHDNVLAKLIDRSFALNNTGFIGRMIQGARWAQGRDVDTPLSLLVSLGDDRIRQQAVEAIGWRFRKRRGPHEPLMKALQHKDPTTQFIAAEGLARGGKADGISVLLASIEYLTDYSMRRRAVRALGELGDIRALDTLLKLANEAGHILQQDAAEALGHLGKSPQGEQIHQLLERFARGNDNLSQNAIKGLRWLNTHNAWLFIRKRAADNAFYHQDTAVEMLGANDDPATRDLLIKLLSTSNKESVVGAALTSARKLWGMDSLDPDYALLSNPNGNSLDDDDVEACVKRVCERGDAKRIFEVLPKAPEDAQEEMARTLMQKSPPPTAEAEAAVTGNEARTVQVAARVLGRGTKPSAKAGTALATALDKWRKVWDERRTKMIKQGTADNDLTRKVTPCLQALLWAAGRLGVSQDAVIAVAAARPDDPMFRPLRFEALLAIIGQEMSPKIGEALEKAVEGNDPETRTLAADTIGYRKADKIAAKVAEKLLEIDRVSFNRLAERKVFDATGMCREKAQKSHYQGVALPYLVKHGDMEGLVALATDRTLKEPARLGAIEALAMLRTAAAEEKLIEIGKNDTEPEELRKAAWRARRRSKRARDKAAAQAAAQAEAPATT